jgi:L,D-peptidoglycan transpeptidase YkuD (ErfK/YbiS/YcfS/YnhG family)
MQGMMYSKSQPFLLPSSQMDNIVQITPDGMARGFGLCLPCTVGKGGIGQKGREGDNVTPTGIWGLEAVFYRPDRITLPVTTLPCQPVTPWCGWCDAPQDAAYNHYVVQPCPVSHERLWREDGAYDVLVVVNYNRQPVIPGKGSAIFLHCLNPENRPTAGCVAFARNDLLGLLAHLTAETQVVIKAS